MGHIKRQNIRAIPGHDPLSLYRGGSNMRRRVDGY